MMRSGKFLKADFDILCINNNKDGNVLYEVKNIFKQFITLVFLELPRSLVPYNKCWACTELVWFAYILAMPTLR